jgi:hypothetical protein
VSSFFFFFFLTYPQRLTEICGPNALDWQSIQATGFDNFADPTTTQPFLAIAVDSSHVAIDTPALEWESPFPNGYPSIGVQPCTNYGHYHDGMNTTNTFTNSSHPTSHLNNTRVRLPGGSAYHVNHGYLPGANSVMVHAPFMQYGNNNILPWNAVPMPVVSYNQGQQDQFMFPQDNMAPGDNFQNFGAAPNMMAHPAAANVFPAGPMAPIQAPPAAIQAAPHQRAQCTICLRSLSRRSDLNRHMNSVHNVGPQVLHLCTVPGCPKSFGAGYSRKDKVTEHLKKVHRL